MLVDNASELDADRLACANSIGITAGASTPAWIIKEVKETMSEITTVDAVAEENFEELLGQSIKTLNTGDKVLGVVTAIGTTEVQVDLGTIGLMVRHFPQVLHEITLTIHCSDSFDHGFRTLQLTAHHIAACQLMPPFL